MGKEVVYCASCQGRILSEDFEKGRAFVVLEKSICDKCKDDYLAGLNPDERERYERGKEEGKKDRRKETPSRGFPPLALREPEVGMPKETPPKGIRAAGSGAYRVLKPDTRALVALRGGGTGPGSNTLWYFVAGGGILLVAIVVVAIVYSKGPGYKPPAVPPAKEFQALQAFARNEANSIDDVLQRIRSAKPKLDNTDFSSRLQELDVAFLSLQSKSKEREASARQEAERIAALSQSFTSLEAYPELKAAVRRLKKLGDDPLESGGYRRSPAAAAAIASETISKFEGLVESQTRERLDQYRLLLRERRYWSALDLWRAHPYLKESRAFQELPPFEQGFPQNTFGVYASATDAAWKPLREEGTPAENWKREGDRWIGLRSAPGSDVADYLVLDEEFRTGEIRIEFDPEKTFGELFVGAGFLPNPGGKGFDATGIGFRLPVMNRKAVAIRIERAGLLSVDPPRRAEGAISPDGRLVLGLGPRAVVVITKIEIKRVE